MPATGFTNAEFSPIQPFQSLFNFHNKLSFSIPNTKQEISIRFKGCPVCDVRHSSFLLFPRHPPNGFCRFSEQGMELLVQQLLEYEGCLIVHHDVAWFLKHYLMLVKRFF